MGVSHAHCHFLPFVDVWESLKLQFVKFKVFLDT